MAGLYIETFGCQMNEADSQEIAQRASAAGYAIVTRPEDAQVVLLNTCTVRDNAERRAYGRMNHFRALKSADPSVRIVVMGCLAEQDRDRMAKLAPHVDAIYGTKELRALGDRLERWRDDFGEDPDVEAIEQRALLEPMGGTADGVTDAFSHLRAFVNVQRGCSYYCTFCIVPHVRGRFDHRPAAEIRAEVAEKIATGAREVMLVGQTVNAWRDPADGTDFLALVRSVAALPGLERLSFISPHPKDFSEATIAGFAEIPALNPRVHLPMQSASDSVLRRMNRKYTRAQFDERVAWIARYLPAWSITTDIIVGFPGETESDFAATLAYVRSGVFANAYSFIYSIRRGTPAANWEQVPREVAHERFERLIEAQNEASTAYHTRKIGRIERCLVVGPSKKDPNRLTAKATDNVTVNAPMPPDYDAARYAREPWLDIEILEAHVWGNSGSVRARAAGFSEPGSAVALPVLSLL